MQSEDRTQDLKIQELKSNQEFMKDQFNELKSEMRKGFTDVKKQLNEQQKHTEQNYVSKEKFEPVKLLVYGMAGVILTTVLYALLKNINIVL